MKPSKQKFDVKSDTNLQIDVMTSKNDVMRAKEDVNI